MKNQQNRRVVLEERPRYTVPTPRCFRIATDPVPQPGKGEMLLRTLCLSMDPYLLSKVKRFATLSKFKPLALGETMNGLSVARVVSSDHPDYVAGDLVMGVLPWADYAVSDGRGVRKMTASLPRVETALGAFGYAGFTAYLAMTVVGKAKPGETVVIGSANSGMAQFAAQIAKRQGCRVVGVSLGEHQCTIPPSQLGFDAYIDSLSGEFAEHLRDKCHNGVDLYFELVGGEVLDATLPLLNHNARIVVGGLKALYVASGLPEGPDRTMLFLNQVMINRLQVLGLVIFDYMKEHHAAFGKEMAGWINSGEIRAIEDVIDNLENAPRALQRMFESGNYGHVVVRVSTD